LFIPDPDPDFLPITDPGVKNKKAPDPGSATLILCVLWPQLFMFLFDNVRTCFRTVPLHMFDKFACLNVFLGYLLFIILWVVVFFLLDITVTPVRIDF
jgi:hypothetical protein